MAAEEVNLLELEAEGDDQQSSKQKCLKLILRSQTVLNLIELCGDSHTISVAPILIVKWKISVHKTDYPRDITTDKITQNGSPCYVFLRTDTD